MKLIGKTEILPQYAVINPVISTPGELTSVKIRTVKEEKKIPVPIREALRDILVGELSRSANNKWKTKEILVKLVLEHFNIDY